MDNLTKSDKDQALEFLDMMIRNTAIGCAKNINPTLGNVTLYIEAGRHVQALKALKAELEIQEVVNE